MHTKQRRLRGRRTAFDHAAAVRRAGRRTPMIEPMEDRRLLTAVAIADAYRLLQDNPLVVSASGVLANDLVASGNPLTVTSNTAPANGSLTVNPNGTFTYTPEAGYSGPDGFSYTIGDGLGNSASAAVNLTVVACAADACVSAGPRLASVDSTQGVLLNALLGNLLGTSLNLTALDWNALAQTQLNGGDIVEALRVNLGLGTTSEALNADATLGQVFSAAATAAQAEGNTAVANIFNALGVQVGGLTGTIQLGDLLQVDPNDGSLADANLNALDFVTGDVQLFNFNNVLTTPSPVMVSGSALGLQSVINSVQLSAQVVEPPVFTCGPVGTQFHTAAVRLKLNLDLVDLQPSQAALAAVLPGTTVQASASLGQVQLFTEVARGDGTIAAIDAISRAVTVEATPGVVDLYLGDISDSLFFNRSRPINPATDVGFGDIGSLNIRLTSLLGVPILDATVGIDARSTAQGQAPFLSTLVFNGPFPETQTASTSAPFLANLASSLVTNLQIQLDGSLGGPLDPLINTIILPVLRPIVANSLAPALGTLLSGLVDPTFDLLGIGLGEMVVTVQGVAQHCPPEANADVASTPEELPVTIPVLGNDARVAGDTVTVTGVTQPANGSVAINPDGTLTYTPPANFNGTATFNYTISNGVNGSTTATVTVQVTPVNDAPVAVANSFPFTEDTPLTVTAPGVLANDSDPDGNPLTALLVTGPANGTLTLNPDGSFTYTPNPNFNGTDSFTYQASDGTLGSNVVAVTLNVGAVNDPPLANPDAASTTADTPATINVLGNDSDPDGNTLAVAAVSSPTTNGGTVANNGDGTVTYTPPTGFTGVDTFSYTASDGNGGMATATVTVSVGLPPNAAPVAVADSFPVTEDTPLTVPGPGVLGNDTDADGNALTALLVSGPSNGTLTLNLDGSFTYTPNPNFSGTDGFTYQANDGGLNSNVVAVTLAVAAVNDPPVIISDSEATIPGLPVTIDVVANDTDPEGNPITVITVSSPTANGGTVVNNGDGTVSYTPPPGFTGDDTFTYTTSDGNGGTATGTVTVTVSPGPNNAPVAIADTFPAVEDTPLTVPGPGVLGNDTDADGNALTAPLVSGPANGTVTLNLDGSFTYTPNPNFNGTDSFTYQANDGSLNSNVVTVTLAVAAVNDAPVANPDAAATIVGTSITVPVVANDADADGNPLNVTGVTQPANGTVVNNGDGTVSYTPAAGFIGVDTFTYTIVDGNGGTATGTVTVTVGLRPNVAPVAVADAFPATEDTPLTVPGPGVLGNDTDADGDPLTALLVTGPANGTLTLAPNGSFTYTPNPNFNGTDRFTYQANDGTSDSDVVTVTLAVAAVNDAPITNPDSITTTQGSPATIPAPGVLGNDSDPDRDALAAALASPPANGTAVLSPDGSLTYTPNPGFSGTDTFSYRASDGTTTSPVTTVTIGVRDVTGPTVLDLSRFGFHAAPTFLVLTFDEGLDPARAGDVGNYRLIGPGRDRRLGTADDRPIALTSAVYDAATRTVTLSPNQRLNLHFTYQLTVSGSPPQGLTDPSGNLLDGDRDGLAGGDFTTTFGRESLRGLDTTAGQRALARRFGLQVVDAGGLSRQLVASLSSVRFRRLLARRRL